MNTSTPEHETPAPVDRDANAIWLKSQLEAAFRAVDKAGTPREAKDILIQVQGDFRQFSLYPQDREVLWQQLQDAFTRVNRQISEEQATFEQEAAENYKRLSTQLALALDQADKATDWREAKKILIEVQHAFRGLRMVGEQREALYDRLQAAFEKIRQRQEDEQQAWEKETVAQYSKLDKMVTDGLEQAQTTSEFRETRAFLIKIQDAFRGSRMVKEQREVLYQRLQEAFSILRERTDAYFREKQKNWEVKMEFRVKDLSAHIQDLEVEILKVTEHLQGLEDQLGILEQRPKDHPSRLIVMAQIQSDYDSIRKYRQQIEEKQQEMEAIQVRLLGGV